VVYSATQQSTKRRVAIKVLPHGSWDSSRQRQRFEREIGLLAAIQHPNVVRLYDGGVTDQDQPYYVMEYVEGVPLDEYLRGPGHTGAKGGAGGRASLDARQDTAESLDRLERDGKGWSIRSVLSLFAQVADAVAAVHQCGMIHRDLKPSNILVDGDGKPYVLDFGLGKRLASSGIGSAAPTVSMSGEFMGTLPWASPEQTEGDPNEVDTRTDVYALGVMLYQLLTGEFPYPVTGGLAEVVEQIRNAEPDRPGALRRDIDVEVDTIVLKCLAKEPGRRYPDASALARDIRHYLAGEPIEAKADSVLYRLRKRLQRHRVTLFAALALLSATVLTAIAIAHVRRSSLVPDRMIDGNGQPMLLVNSLPDRDRTLDTHVGIGHGGRKGKHVVRSGKQLRTKPAMSIQVGYDSSGELEVRAGGAVTAGALRIGYLPTGVGRVLLRGAGAELKVLEFLVVSEFGEGRLEVCDGAQVSCARGHVGWQPSGRGHVLLRGRDTSWLNKTKVEIGREGVGVLEIRDGAEMQNLHAFIAFGDGSRGEVRVAGHDARWFTKGSLYVGGESPQSRGDASLTVKDGGTVVVRHALKVRPTGMVALSGGTVSCAAICLADGGAFEFADGELKVNRFEGDLIQGGGVLQPGHAAGAIQVRGDYQQTGGRLQLAIGGRGTGAVEVLEVGGTARLGGDLVLSLLNGFQPGPDDIFTVLRAGRIEDGCGFAHVTIVGGGTCSVEYRVNEVVLKRFTGPFAPRPLTLQPREETPFMLVEARDARFPRRLVENAIGEHELTFLGPPDNVAWGLGDQSVTYDFADVRIVDQEGPDFNVYERPRQHDEFEHVDVLVSADGAQYASVKASEGAVVRIPGDEQYFSFSDARSYDLRASGLSTVRFVRITGTEARAPALCGGFELDAIGAVHIAPADSLPGDDVASQPSYPQ
jgi:T5SS/PEP-CTERM-associated repeat protein